HVLISRSRDGNLVAFTSKFLRLGVIRGSRKSRRTDTHKRGAGALREMVKILKNGDVIFMTPDGPRGPRMRMGEGPLRLAQLSGAPVLAYGLSTSRHLVFNSWDRFMLPLPFGRGQIIWAGPMTIPRNASDADIEILRLKLENLLNSATQEADTSVGNTPILPADIPVKLKS
ncbi:MAG: lysophospholipid acyltransferase family protein, partial [Robiginitomaculum sp.]|nr:lysophospholipid acyltransferase family protein [Robiginitomaculum sp.]